MNKLHTTILGFLGCLFGILLLNSTATFAQKEYKGTTHFFNLIGEWENKNSAEKITKLSITNTIVNSYRVLPYFKLGNKELPYPKAIPLKISEKDLAYVADLEGTHIKVMPIKIKGEDALKVYYFILDPEGQWTGMTTDILKRKNGVTGGMSTLGFSAKNYQDFWVNEWEENQSIARLHIIDKGGLTYVKPYKILGGKPRLLGETKAKYDPNTLALSVRTIKTGLTSTMILHPIFENNVMVGIDMIVEEVYSDKVPKGLTRQFFIKDLEGNDKQKAENIVTSVEGEWENFDKNGRTRRLLVRGGDVSIWVNCIENGGCLLGKKPIQRLSDAQSDTPVAGGNLGSLGGGLGMSSPSGGMGGDMNISMGGMSSGGFGGDFGDENDASKVGALFTTMATSRSVEMETDLDVNKGLSKPRVLVITTTIEDIEGIKPPTLYTEVFRRAKKKEKKKGARGMGMN